MCLSPTIPTLLTEVLFPLLVAILAYYFVTKRDDWIKKKQNSRLGVAILESLLEEVKNGIKIMTDFSENESVPPQILLPNKSWNGTTTISDEILLRIIETSKGIEPSSFPPNQIKIHLKNYFDIMTNEWNNKISSTHANSRITQARILIHDRKFIEATDSVRKMLKQSIQLLESNSKKRFPD